jgi:hypothetical protein
MIDEEFVVNTPKGDYSVSITIDVEEDNEKAWTEVTTPCGNVTHLDITPYWPEHNLIKRMIRFHSMFGYWVTRQMVGSGGPIEMHELEEIFEEAIVGRTEEAVNEYKSKFNHES